MNVTSIFLYPIRILLREYKALYLGYCIGRSNSSWANYVVRTFPLPPEEAPMLLTQEGCGGPEVP